MKQETIFSKVSFRQKFEDFYINHAEPLLDKYNQEREKYRFSCLCTMLFAISLPLIIVNIKFLILTFVSILFLLINNNFKPATANAGLAYEDALKRKLMPKFLAIFGDFKWSKYLLCQHQKYYNIIKNLQIFPKLSALTFDDFIKGSFSDVDIEIIEIRGQGFKAFMLIVGFYLAMSFYVFSVLMLITLIIFQFTKITGVICLSLLAIFTAILLLLVLFNLGEILKNSNGVLIKYDFPKNFKTSTFIMDKKSLIKRILYKDWKDYEQVQLEDIEFNKKFIVMSKNQIEARYLLTLTLIERFKNIGVAFNAYSQRAEFKDNSLYIFMGTKQDLFKMGSLNEYTTYLTFEDFFEELYSIISIIEQLKLDQKIGL